MEGSGTTSIAAVPLFAVLSDRLGRRRLCMAGALLALLWAFQMLWLFDTGNPVLITVAFSVGMIAFAVLYGPMGAYLPELFGTRLRYCGASVSYNLGGVLGGAFAPIIAASLLLVAGGSWAISLYIALMAGLSLACLYFLTETHLTDTSGMREEERDLLAERGVVPK
ncbi:MAG TPA: MFS transporter [Rubrobacter sp.]|nr:MFS transporter [Rubrobacter sp.]